MRAQKRQKFYAIPLKLLRMLSLISFKKINLLRKLSIAKLFEREVSFNDKEELWLKVRFNFEFETLRKIEI